MKQRLYVFLIVLISGSFIFTTIQDGSNWGGDFALYINQSIHLIEGFSLGDLYEWNKISMQSSISQIGPYLYPNGFPILLSPIYYIFGIDFIVMKIFCSLFFLLSIPLMFNLFKEHYKSITFPIISTCLIAFNYHFIAFSDNILSDFPFFFFCLLTFYIMKSKNNILNQILLGVCLFYSYFVRDVGILLIPTLLIYQIFHSKEYSKNRYLTIIPYLIFIIFFFLIQSIFPTGGENHIQMIVSNLSLSLIENNLRYYLLLLSKMFFFNQGSLFIGLTIVIISLLGAFKNTKEHLHFFIFILFNLLIIIIWPGMDDFRLLFPILPFVIFFSIHGIIFILERLKMNIKYQKYMLVTYLVVFSLYSFKKIVSIDSISNEAYTNEMVDIYQYISHLEPADKIIGFKKPRVLYLFSGAKSIYTDLNHFDSSIANYLLLKKDLTIELSQFKIQKEFQNYILIKHK